MFPDESAGLDGTIAVRPGEEVDRNRLAHYLYKNLSGLPEGRLEIRQFSSGASNLTYLIQIGDWEAVLRRPPLGPVAPRAHDVLRESSLLQAIHPVFPLAPRPLQVCANPDILGAPF